MKFNVTNLIANYKFCWLRQPDHIKTRRGNFAASVLLSAPSSSGLRNIASDKYRGEIYFSPSRKGKLLKRAICNSSILIFMFLKGRGRLWEEERGRLGGWREGRGLLLDHNPNDDADDGDDDGYDDDDDVVEGGEEGW